MFIILASRGEEWIRKRVLGWRIVCTPRLDDTMATQPPDRCRGKVTERRRKDP